MNYFRKYIRKYWVMFSVAVLFLVFEATADLILPSLIARMIDEGVAFNRMDVVLELGGMMLLITAFGAISASIRNVVSSQVSQRFGAELRADLFRKIQHLSYANVNKFEQASLITRLTNDVTQVQQFVNGLMRIFVKSPILAIGALIMAIRLDSRLAMVFAVIVPIIALLITIQMKVGFPRFMKVQDQLDQVNRVTREYLSGVRVVRAFHRFDYEVEKFQDTNQTFMHRSIGAMRLMSLFNPVIMLTVNFGIIAVLWVGGRWVHEGTLQVGVIVAFTNYMTQLLFSLMMISMVFLVFIRAKASAQRIAEVFAEKNSMTWERDQPELREPGKIEFDNVSFSYVASSDSSATVLRNISFCCQPGETIGIIGSTGSGKSTLVSLIPRFYDAVSGTIRISGKDVRMMDPQRLREHIAIVPQKSVLFSGSILENIRWGKGDATQEEVEQAARLAEAHPFVVEMPEGYDSRLGQGGVNLSGGQKQRISIARALVRKPDILILDDCTSAVDVATEARIKASLRTYAQGLTCLIVAQRITSVMDADRILVLDDGNLVGEGTHQQLLQSCKVYQEIYHSQIGKESIR